MRNLIVPGLLALLMAAAGANAQTAAPTQSKETAKPAETKAAVASSGGAMVVSKNEPGKVAAAATARASAEVTAVDAATRKVTLKGQNGKSFDVIAGDEVKNFAQIKAGDKVTVEYLRAFTAEVKKVAKGEMKAATATVKETENVSAKPGEKPAGAEGVKVTALVDVIAVNKKNKTITVKGAKGNTVKLDVKNPDHFKAVKKGDQIEIVYVEAMALAVTAAK